MEIFLFMFSPDSTSSSPYFLFFYESLSSALCTFFNAISVTSMRFTMRFFVPG